MRALAAAPLLLALTAACGGPSNGDDDVPCQANLLPGDLVVTEVFANATGDDEGKEWFEIYNATPDPVNLQGMLLLASKSDGTDEAGHVMTEQVIDPSSYLVMGGVLPDLKPDYVDYGYGADLRVGSSRGLPNSDGRIAMQCGDVMVDEMTYVEAAEAASLAFDGQTAPDYTLNDDTAMWCDSTTEFETGSFGTPGSANDGCASVNPTQCDDGAGIRPVMPPGSGDLVISEYMARPDSTVGAANGEWLEIFAVNDVDLNGLQLGRAEPSGGPQAVRTTLSSPDCLSVSAGSYVVIARNADMAVNGGIPQVDYLLGFGITDSDDGLFIGWGGTVLDAVTWTTQRPAATAVSLDPSKLDPTENDTDAYWCNAVDTYGTQKGTPGAANPSCDIPPPDGMCYQGADLVTAVAPTAGQLVINEYQAHPSTTIGVDGEWIELYASAEFDLNGVQLGQLEANGVIQTINPTQCLHVTADSYVLVARSTDMSVNGMLPTVDVRMVRDSNQSAWGLTDSNSGVFVAYGGTTLDAVTWTSTTQGRSRQRDPAMTSTFCLTPATATYLYGADNYGTPRAANGCN
ncbi:MAG TPA: hypothetical protein VL172_03785 [Kofleriaceae bacterium]|nr:hypothetical protein [Kofleriaceae bacterium]